MMKGVPGTGTPQTVDKVQGESLGFYRIDEAKSQ